MTAELLVPFHVPNMEFEFCENAELEKITATSTSEFLNFMFSDSILRWFQIPNTKQKNYLTSARMYRLPRDYGHSHASY